MLKVYLWSSICFRKKLLPMLFSIVIGRGGVIVVLLLLLLL